MEAGCHSRFDGCISHDSMAAAAPQAASASFGPFNCIIGNNKGILISRKKVEVANLAVAADAADAAVASGFTWQRTNSQVQL